MSEIGVGLFITYALLGAISVVALIGKPRKPMTHAAAIVALGFLLLESVIVLYLYSQIP